MRARALAVVGPLEARDGWGAHLAVVVLCILIVILLHFPLRLAAGPLLLPLHNKVEREGGVRTEKQSGQKEGQEQKQKRSGQQREGPSKSDNVQQEIARIVRDLQFALEGGSAQGVLSLTDSTKFRNYASFQDTVERLVREDTIRAYFRQVSGSRSAEKGRARSRVDAEMELARKDAAGQTERRRRQLEFEFERTRRGWRITNITPRTFFEPL